MSTSDRVPVTKTYKLFVGGTFVRSESARTERQLDVDGAYVADYARASRKDLRDAVTAARKAQAGWVARSAFNRGQILFRVSEMLESGSDRFVSALVRLEGASEVQARREVEAAVDRAFWYAGWCDKLAQVLGSVNPIASPYFDFTLPEPQGVVCVLAPRSSSLLGLVSAIAPALVPGNTVVAIVDGPAPLVALELAEVLATSDVPAGVVNLLTGPRDELAPHAASHMDVNALLAFGVEGELARELEAATADNLKRTVLLPDPPRGAWSDERQASPYLIERLLEWKTAWHPIGT